MDKKINIQCFKNILSFLDIDTIKNITKICNIEKIIPNIIILDFIDDNLIQTLGEKCIYNDVFQQKFIKNNLFKCKSQSLIFMENKYNLL